MSLLAEMIREDAVKDSKLEIAKNLIKKGLGIKLIADATGLDNEIVESLHAEIDEDCGTNPGALF